MKTITTAALCLIGIAAFIALTGCAETQEPARDTFCEMPWYIRLATCIVLGSLFVAAQKNIAWFIRHWRGRK